MDGLVRALTVCPLFQGFTNIEIVNILQQITYQTRAFGKGEPVAIEGEPCPCIGIVIEGSAEIQRVYASGKIVTIDTLVMGNSFGEVILFSDVQWYPVTIIAKQEIKVIYLSKNVISELCHSHTVFLNNLLKQLSNRILLLNQRIKSLSYQTIRQKIAGFLLDEYRRQNIYCLTLSCSRRELADQLGIPRPSLSRELAQMKHEQLIDFHKNTIVILNLNEVQNCLLE